LSPVQHEKIFVLTLAEIKSERIFKYNMIEERIQRLEELNSIKKNTRQILTEKEQVLPAAHRAIASKLPSCLNIMIDGVPAPTIRRA
jgi:hypothetical protein